MIKFVRVLLPLVLAGGTVVMTGCGGGSSSLNDTARYAGNYSGTFKGNFTSDNSPFNGTFAFTADSSGNIKGTGFQKKSADSDEFTFELSGTVSSNGKLALAIRPSEDQLATITGNISNVGTGELGATFVTTLSSETIATGTLIGARATTK